MDDEVELEVSRLRRNELCETSRSIYERSAYKFTEWLTEFDSHIIIDGKLQMDLLRIYHIERYIGSIKFFWLWGYTLLLII